MSYADVFEPVEETDPYEIASNKLRDSFRKMAGSSGWPEEIINQVDVRVEDSNILVQYPDSIAKEVGDLEYGHLKNPPRAAIRKMTARSQDVVSEIAFSKVSNQLTKGGLF